MWICFYFWVELVIIFMFSQAVPSFLLASPMALIWPPHRSESSGRLGTVLVFLHNSFFRIPFMPLHRPQWVHPNAGELGQTITSNILIAYQQAPSLKDSQLHFDLSFGKKSNNLRIADSPAFISPVFRENSAQQSSKQLGLTSTWVRLSVPQ